MDVEIAGDEYAIFLTVDDCALLQLGPVTIDSGARRIKLELTTVCDDICIEEKTDGLHICVHPTQYAVLLHMSFAVADCQGKRIWLHLGENEVKKVVA